MFGTCLLSVERLVLYIITQSFAENFDKDVTSFKRKGLKRTINMVTEGTKGVSAIWYVTD